MSNVGVTVLLTDADQHLLNTLAYKREHASAYAYLQWLVNRWALELHKPPKPAPPGAGEWRRFFKVPPAHFHALQQHRSAFGSTVNLVRALIYDDARRLGVRPPT